MMQIILYLAAIIFTIVSFIKDKDKTLQAIKKGLLSFENILPTVLCVMTIVGISLSIVDERLIANILGPKSGLVGIIVSLAIGSITMMGGFIAFPLGATLMERGAGPAQVATFISALMMVGFLTLPLESRYWGKKATVLRNILGIVVSLAVGVIMGWVYK